jgi:hypothetical protein
MTDPWVAELRIQPRRWHWLRCEIDYIEAQRLFSSKHVTWHQLLEHWLNEATHGSLSEAQRELMEK